MTKTTAPAIVWADPPKQNRGTADAWADEAQALRDNPGKWAILAAGRPSPSSSQGFRNGALKAFQPKGAFESRSAKNTSGTYDVYVRYVGVE